LGREAVDALRRFIEQADSLGVLVTTSGVGGKGRAIASLCPHGDA